MVFLHVDVIGILTDSPDQSNYWKVFKYRLIKEGNQSVTNCNQLKMQSSDGKFYLTDVADTEQLLRLIQSIPSPKAEPFKQWLAKVGYERKEESQNPEMSIDRAIQNYLQPSYSKEWINQWLKSIEVRKELTDERENRGVKKDKSLQRLQISLHKHGLVSRQNSIRNSKIESIPKTFFCHSEGMAKPQITKTLNYTNGQLYDNQVW